MSDTDRLHSALEEARRYLGELPSPPNEANTCDWVIRPLLVALGYANHEIYAQSSDVSNRFPDYTILPNTDYTWYLEAKTWSAALESQHVDQAMNYAHSNGRRWVVLSNGQEWRLYDDRILGKSADRLVATARLDDENGMKEFLSALSRDSMTSEQVDSFASERRLREYVTTAISDPGSLIVQAVLEVVRKSVQNLTVTPEAIVGILNAAQSTHTPVSSVSSKPPVAALSASPENSLFICKGKGAHATGRFNGEGIVVLPGSKTRRHGVPSIEPWYSETSKRYIAEGKLADRGDHFEVLTEIPFGSPSGAAVFVLGSAANGWWCWIAPNGKLLREVHPKAR